MAETPFSRDVAPAFERVGRGEPVVLLHGVTMARPKRPPKDDKEQPLPGQEFSGGWVMHGPGFEVVTANITPHKTNWMGIATKEQFIARFRSYADFKEVRPRTDATPSCPGFPTPA